MSQAQEAFDKAVSLIDAANSEDPNKVTDEAGKQWPKELIYSQRMSDMLQRFAPDTDDVARLAIRAQHIQRWKTPREDYPMDRIGYLQWRTSLYKLHGETTAELLAQAGYNEGDIKRAKKMIGKKGIKVNADSQLLEDIADLVFIEHYMLAFVEKHPEYDEEKWLTIIRKTWKKMSERGREFTLQHVSLAAEHLALVEKALAAKA